MVLYKRVPRLFRKEFLRNLILMLLIVTGMSVVLGGALGNAAIINTNKNAGERNNLESGSFSSYRALSEGEMKKLEKNGTVIAEQFYKDLDAGEGKTLRIFQNREKINVISLDEGRPATKKNDIALEKHYAEANGLSVGDPVRMKGEVLNVTGIGSAPDYSYVKKNASDLNSNTAKFSVAFVTEETFEMFEDEPVYNYSYKLGAGDTNHELKKRLSDADIKSNILIRENNTRITAYEDDCSLMHRASLITGIIFMILVAYILTIFVKSIIEREEAVIGTLYSLGYKKEELIRVYMLLPAGLVLASSIISILTAFCFTGDLLASDSVALYSMPALEKEIDLPVILYGIIMPFGVTVIVNYISLHRNLSRKPIALLRRIRERSGLSKSRLKRVNFFTAFRIREFLSEFRSNIILSAGIFVASLLLVLGFTIEAGMEDYVNHATDDVEYSHEYLIRQFPDEIPYEGEAVLHKRLNYGPGNMEILLIGIQEDSAYYNFRAAANPRELTVSSGFAQKYGFAEGDTVRLEDVLDDKEYLFKISKIVDFNYSLCVFQNIDTVRDLFDYDDSYYTGIVSDRALPFADKVVLSTATRSQMTESAKALTENMEMMLLLIQGMGLIVFAAVIFLIVRMHIGKAAFSISLIKIFGYAPKEISRIYLGVPFFVTLVSAAVFVPLNIKIVGKLYPFLTEDIPAYFSGTLDAEMRMYLVVYMLIVYIIVNLFLMKQIKRVPLSEVIKDRE